MDALLLKRLAQRSTAEWIDALNRAGVACGPIYRVDEVFADPQVTQAGLVHEHVHETFGPVRVVGLPVHLSRTPPTVRTPAPVFAAHTREVLAGAGYAPSEIEALAEAGVIEVTK
jgi:crotonobetainyl-CoA:carnitine CoA-transferase CaiB-like acyl-CoA transferase